MNSASTTWSIASVADNSAPGCDAVREWLREHNWKVNPEFMEKIHQPRHEGWPLVLLATAESEVVGGLFAETQLAWLRISIMAVSPIWRSRGVGATLLAHAEREAAARGCLHAYVDTMDYQAPRLYLAHGYRVAGEIADWDSHGHCKYFFTKELRDIPR
jgi:GNAT superfamily N-acetyltransferase